MLRIPYCGRPESLRALSAPEKKPGSAQWASSLPKPGPFSGVLKKKTKQEKSAMRSFNVFSSLFPAFLSTGLQILKDTPNSL